MGIWPDQRWISVIYETWSNCILMSPIAFNRKSTFLHLSEQDSVLVTALMTLVWNLLLHGTLIMWCHMSNLALTHLFTLLSKPPIILHTVHFRTTLWVACQLMPLAVFKHPYLFIYQGRHPIKKANEKESSFGRFIEMWLFQLQMWIHLQFQQWNPHWSAHGSDLGL